MQSSLPWKEWPLATIQTGTGWLRSVSAENDFWIWIDKKLNMSQQCALVPKKVKNILGYIYRNIADRLREVIISLSSALVSSYLEYCGLYFGSPIHKKTLTNWNKFGTWPLRWLGVQAHAQQDRARLFAVMHDRRMSNKNLCWIKRGSDWCGGLIPASNSAPTSCLLTTPPCTSRMGERIRRPEARKTCGLR